jgi:hypothetical protein
LPEIGSGKLVFGTITELVRDIVRHREHAVP